MAAKRFKGHWIYCVDAQTTIACFKTKSIAVKRAQAAAKKSRVTVAVEKVKTVRGGGHDHYAKGAGVVWKSK